MLFNVHKADAHLVMPVISTALRIALENEYVGDGALDVPPVDPGKERPRQRVKFAEDGGEYEELCLPACLPACLHS
jgi:hypothetical protein